MGGVSFVQCVMSVGGVSFVQCVMSVGGISFGLGICECGRS